MSETFQISNNTSLVRFLPEPQSNFFHNVGSTINKITSMSSRMGTALVHNEFSELVAQQQAAQMQMMLVSMQSNLSRTEHETKMAAIRNMRVA